MVNDFLATMNYDAPRGSQGRRMMERKLRTYLWWKGELNRRRQPQRKSSSVQPARASDGDAGISEALRKKDREFRERQASRRRVRGGAASQASGREKSNRSTRMVAGSEVLASGLPGYCPPTARFTRR